MPYWCKIWIRWETSLKYKENINSHSVTNCRNTTISAFTQAFEQACLSVVACFEVNMGKIVSNILFCMTWKPKLGVRSWNMWFRSGGKQLGLSPGIRNRLLPHLARNQILVRQIKCWCLKFYQCMLAKVKTKRCLILEIDVWIMQMVDHRTLSKGRERSFTYC